ncbi:uncharacterized protein LOC144152417 [Haemaphysalis longicornis]
MSSRPWRNTATFSGCLGDRVMVRHKRLLLQLYKGLVLARPIYALPLLHHYQRSWVRLERAQRRALRICLGVPPTTSSRHMLNETGVNMVQNVATERAEPPPMNPKGLWSRLKGRQSKLTSLLHQIAGEPVTLTSPPPDERPHRVEMEAGLRRPKRELPTVAVRQLAKGHLGDNYKGWHRVYTDGSVDPLLRMAAAVTGGEEESVAERLSFYFSSTTAELAALSLGLGRFERRAADPEGVVLLCDSKAALGHLRNPDRAPGLAKSIVARAGQLRRQGWDRAYQWLPAHCGILGNETVSRMAVAALEGAGSQNPTVLPFEEARLLIHRTIARKHPDRAPPGLSPRRHIQASRHRPAPAQKWQRPDTSGPGPVAAGKERQLHKL